MKKKHLPSMRKGSIPTSDTEGSKGKPYERRVNEE